MTGRSPRLGRRARVSSLWRLGANREKDDVYLATRQSAFIFKISLHASGDKRLQWVGQNRGDVTYTSLAVVPSASRSYCTSPKP